MEQVTFSCVPWVVPATASSHPTVGIVVVATNVSSEGTRLALQDKVGDAEGLYRYLLRGPSMVLEVGWVHWLMLLLTDPSRLMAEAVRRQARIWAARDR